MLQENLKKLKLILNESSGLDVGLVEKIQGLIQEMESEIRTLVSEQTDGEPSDLSSEDQPWLEHPVERFENEIQKLQGAHPQAAEVFQRLNQILSNMGI